MIPVPPRANSTDTLFPSTSLVRLRAASVSPSRGLCRSDRAYERFRSARAGGGRENRRLARPLDHLHDYQAGALRTGARNPRNDLAEERTIEIGRAHV